MSSYSYSQTGYPRRIVYNGDTVIAITQKQMQSINLAHVSWRECIEVQDSLLNTLDSCSVAFSLYDTTIQNLRGEINLLQRSIADRDSVIYTHQGILTSKNKEIKRLRTKCSIVSIGAGALAVLSIVALIL